jgi:hypothetical protein
MFYHNTPARKLSVIRFLLFTQLVVLARLYRDETICMVFSYPLVSTVGVKGYRTAYAFPYGVFVHREVMLAALGFLHVDDLPAVPLDYDLRLQRMPFFFPE